MSLVHHEPCGHEADEEEDKEGLDAFLKKIGGSKTADMDDDTTVAELESAYSTLNTLAYLCIRAPVLPADMKSVMGTGIAKTGSAKSMKLLP